MLSGGDLNIYSLFVERAMTLINPGGIIGLLTPSGIASDKTAAPFFKSLSTSGRLRALYDFENKGDGRPLYFPDVHAQFKFCALVASRAPSKQPARCAFFLNNPSEIENPERCFPLSPDDFARVNPNTGTAPIFRTRRDANLTATVYKRLPVLVDRSGDNGEVKAWPVRYATTFHMTNDSHLFRTREELEENEGAWKLEGNRWRSVSGDWVPLYEGKMIWHFDHRAASVVVNLDNQHRPAFPKSTEPAQHRDPMFVPDPQFWVLATEAKTRDRFALTFRDVTNPTDRRTMDACFIPHQYAGNTLPLVLNIDGNESALALLCANFNAFVLDFIARQKVQKNHLNWYVVEQLPVVPIEGYSRRFGKKTAAEIVREAVLELTYTSNDMAAFARDMNYVKADGTVKPPFIWDERRRLTLRAKLDAVYFHLYGITDRDDVRYIYSTFSVVEREETRDLGHYASRDLCLAWMNALKAGKPDEAIALPT